MNLQATAAATEKSRCLREIQELKDQLFRANASSDRDSVLKDKVFNDAKTEVMNLNKKVCFFPTFECPFNKNSLPQYYFLKAFTNWVAPCFK